MRRAHRDPHSHSRRRHRRVAHSLRRRIFTWFGVTIGATSAVIWGTLTFFGGGPQWSNELKKAKTYVAGNYAAVWADPVATDELTRRTERDLQIRIRLFDASGAPLHRSTAEALSPAPEVRWCKDPFRVAVRDPKDARALGTIEACFVIPPQRSARFITTLLLALLSVWTAAGFLARRIAKPYLAIGHAADRFGNGDLATRMDESNTSLEARQVARAFNAMASQIEKQIADRKALLATVSHEIRTPLARMQFLLERLLGVREDQKREQDELRALREELLGLNSLVEDLLASSRIEMGKGDWKEFDVVDLVLRAMEDLELDPSLLSVEMADMSAEGRTVGRSQKSLMGDPTLVRRAVVNLLANAGTHADRILGIQVRLSPEDVTFSVEDEGPGLSESDLEHAFDAFYKNPKTGTHKSTGMGLHIVERVAELHHGRVSASNRKDEGGRIVGAKFVFVLSRGAGKVSHADPPPKPRAKSKQPAKPKVSAADREVLAFETPAKWRAWLKKNHLTHSGIWLRLFKKNSGFPTVSAPEALDEALCHGWIDAQRDRLDEISFLQRYTPRRPKGLWSQRNIEHIDRLTRAGKMTPKGLAEVEAAKRDGRWAVAYAPQREAKVPEDFLKRLAKDKNAFAFFETLSRQNHFAIYFRLTTAKKPETRERRMQTILETLGRGERLV